MPRDMAVIGGDEIEECRMREQGELAISPSGSHEPCRVSGVSPWFCSNRNGNSE